MADLDLASLFGGGAGGGVLSGTNPIDSREANTMSLLQAMQQVHEAGTQRTASPIGAIAQALIPIIAAPIQARQMQQKSQLESILAAAKIATAQAQLAEALKPDKGVNLSTDQELVRRLRAGEPVDDLIKAKQALQKPSNPTEVGIAQAAEMGDPLAQATWQRIVAGKSAAAGATAAAGAAARFPWEMQAYERKKEIDQQVKSTEKKPLPQAVGQNYSKMVEGLTNLDDVIGEFENGQVTRGDATKAWLSRGLVSSPTLRAYASYYNDVANRRFKSRVTGAEMGRLSKELPPPESYIVDPVGFIKSLRKAREIAAGALKREHAYDSGTFEVPTEITQDVERLTAPRQSPVPGRDAAVQKIMQKTGWSRDRAEAALDAQ